MEFNVFYLYYDGIFNDKCIGFWLHFLICVEGSEILLLRNRIIVTKMKHKTYYFSIFLLELAPV